MSLFEFKLPDIGEGVHEGEIAKWHVAVGQAIEEDSPMVEVMTDKVTVEITAPKAGTVGAIHYKEGDLVKVGAVIIAIETTAEAPATVDKQPLKVEAKVATENQVLGALTHDSEVVRSTSLKVLAAPAIRKHARAQGIDLSRVQGSGPHGRIKREDLTQSTQPSQLPTPVACSSKTSPTETRVPFRGMRRKIASHLSHSKHTAPHFTYVEEADFTRLVALRQTLLPEATSRGVKLTYLPFIMKALVEGFKRYPVLNSMLDEPSQEIVLKHHYNLGVAMATEEGLIVPVVHHVDEKPIFQLALEIHALTDKARHNKLQLSDLQHGTFTITSIGSIGGIFSAPIINHPEVAIIGIQKIEKRPVVREEAIVIREMSYLSISCDHRVVDGSEAAYFMKEVIHWLEHPEKMLLSALV
jgi:pyruvate dehydrogenase E2 component (dihydrolipoamide acetyltransferase)